MVGSACLLPRIITLTLLAVNADLKFNGLWKPIIEHFTDEDEEVVLRACWVCGTAVQVSRVFTRTSHHADPYSLAEQRPGSDGRSSPSFSAIAPSRLHTDLPARL